MFGYILQTELRGITEVTAFGLEVRVVRKGINGKVRTR